MNHDNRFAYYVHPQMTNQINIFKKITQQIDMENVD